MLLSREYSSYRWNPAETSFPSDVAFLFVSSALGKIVGLAQSELTAKFLAWSPENPPSEPNHLNLRGLIVDKAKTLVPYAVEQLRETYDLPNQALPQRYLVGDVHPSIGHPGSMGDYHLVKPKAEMTYVQLMNFILSPWEHFQDKPVTVQLASAYTMVNQKGFGIGSCGVKHDSVYMTYATNPLRVLKDVLDYVDELKTVRFGGYSQAALIIELSRIAGGIFNEYLYQFARKKGIEVTVSSGMSTKLSEHESIDGIGAGGLTPAIVGWIDQKARQRIKSC